MSAHDDLLVPQPLVGDPARQAHDAQRGFNYQVWRSVLLWLSLTNQEVMYLEGAEDIDIVGPIDSRAIQVRNTGSTISLNTAHALKALENFLEIQCRNPSTVVKYTYLTTSTVAQESGRPFGAEAKGIELWQECRNATHFAAVEESIRAILNFLKSKSARYPRLSSLLAASSPEDVYASLIRKFEWITDEPAARPIRETINDQLVYLGEERSVSSDRAEAVADALFTMAAEIAETKTPTPLSRADLIRTFDFQTRVSMPMQVIDNMMNALSAGIAKGNVPGSLRISIDEFIPPPISIESMVSRSSAFRELLSALDSSAAVFIVGGTGIGKSTLAALIASSLPMHPIWVDARNRSSSEVEGRVKAASSYLQSVALPPCLVLDDLDLVGDTRAFSNAIRRLIPSISSRLGRLIVTSYNRPGTRLQQELGINDSAIFEVPKFTEEEVVEFLTRHGCSEQTKRERWASIILTQTGGHPQLVAARVAALIQVGYPEPNWEEWVTTPQAVIEARTEARHIIVDTLDQPARELLYRLSIAIHPFRRIDALRIAGGQPEIDRPGENFDQISGPWLERRGNEYYRISPLAVSAAKDVYPPERLKELHALIARAVLFDRSITQNEFSAGLYHATLGDESSILLRLSSTFIGATDQIQRRLSDENRWFAVIGTQPGGTIQFTDERVRKLVRSVQLSIAIQAAPTAIGDVVDCIDRELPMGSQSFEDLGLRLLTTISLITSREATLAPRRLVSRLHELSGLFQILEQAIPGMVPFAALSSLEAPAGLTPVTALWAFITFKVRAMSDINDILDHYENCAPDERAFLSQFICSERHVRQLLDAAWSKEMKRDAPDTAACLAAFQYLYDWGVAHDNLALIRTATRMQALITNESLRDPQAAIQLLAARRDRCGDAIELADEMSSILYGLDDLQGSLNALIPVMRSWRASIDVAETIYSYSMRRAGICATKLGDYTSASEYYAAASEVAFSAGDQVFGIGLLADAAFTKWKAGRPGESLALYKQVVESLETIPNDDRENIRAYYLHKAVSKALARVSAAVDRDESLSDPFPGEASNPYPNASITETDPTSRDFAWANLYRLQIHYGGIELPESVIARVLASPFAGVRWMAQIALLRMMLRNGTVNGLLAVLFEYGTSTLEMARARGNADALLEGRQVSALLVTMVNPFLVTGLLSGVFVGSSPVVAFDNDLPGLLGRLDGEVRRWIVDLQVSLHSEHFVARADLRDNAIDIEKRLLAAVSMLLHGTNSPDDSYYAHILIFMYSNSNHYARIAWENIFSTYVRDAWIQHMNNRALLQFPAVNVPAVLNACNSLDSGWKRVATILIAVQPAVGVGIPTEIRSALLKDATNGV